MVLASFLFVILITHAVLSIPPTNTFCKSHTSCQCPDPRELKCRFNSSTLSVDFIDTDVLKIDFSSNSLTNFVFGDNTLNVKTLILSDNRIAIVHEKMFNRMPHLEHLDLSRNSIEAIKDTTVFDALSMLRVLNLSRAFVDDYTMNRDLCELYLLRELDVSYANMADFTLECWG